MECFQCGSPHVDLSRALPLPLRWEAEAPGCPNLGRRSIARRPSPSLPLSVLIRLEGSAPIRAQNAACCRYSPPGSYEAAVPHCAAPPLHLRHDDGTAAFGPSSARTIQFQLRTGAGQVQRGLGTEPVQWQCNAVGGGALYGSGRRGLAVTVGHTRAPSASPNGGLASEAGRVLGRVLQEAAGSYGSCVAGRIGPCGRT